MASIGNLNLTVTADVSSLTDAINTVEEGFQTVQSAAASLSSRLSDIGVSASEDQLADLVYSLSQSTDSLDEAESAAYDWVKALNQTSTPTSTAITAVTNLADAIADGNVDTKTWQQALQVLPDTLDDVAQELLGAESNATDLKKALDNGLISTEDFGDALNEAVSDADDLADGVEDLADEIDDATDSADSFSVKGSAAFSAVATVVSKVVGSAIDYMSDCLDSAISRADTLSNYETVMTNLGYSAEEAAESLETMSDGISGLPTALDDMASSVQGVAAAMGTDLSTATDVAVAMNDALLASGSSTDTVSNAMQQFTNILSKGSVDADAWNTLVQAMPGQLKQVAEEMLGAGSSASDLYDALSDGTVSLDDFTDTLVRLDQEGSDSVTSFSQQAQDATGGVSTSMENVKTAVVRQMANIIKAFNDDGTISNFFGAVADGIDTVGGYVNDYLVPAVKDIVDWIQNTLIPLCQNTLIPALEAFLPVITGVASAFAAWKAAMKIESTVSKVTETLGKLSDGQGVLGLVKSGINGVTGAFDMLKLTFSSHPFGLIITVIAALVAAFITLYTTNEDFRNTVNEIWQAIVDFITPIIESIVGFFTETIPNAIQSAIEWFQNIPENVSNALSSALESVTNWAQSVWDSAVEAGSNFINSIVEFFSQSPEEIGYQLGLAIGNVIAWAAELVSNAKQAASDFVENVKNFIVNLPSNFKSWLDDIISKVTSWASSLKQKASDAASTFISNIKSYITNLPSNFKSWLDSVITKVKNFASDLGEKATQAASDFKDNIIDGIKSIPDKVVSIGGDIVSGVWTGIKNKFTEFYNNVTGFFSGIVDGVKEALGIASPSKVFRDEVGKWIPEGVAVGIDANTDSVAAAMNDLNNEMINGAAKLDTSMIDTSLDVSDSNKIDYDQLGNVMMQAFTTALSNVPQVRTFQTADDAAVWLGRAMNEQLQKQAKRQAVFA